MREYPQSLCGDFGCVDASVGHECPDLFRRFAVYYRGVRVAQQCTLVQEGIGVLNTSSFQFRIDPARLGCEELFRITISSSQVLWILEPTRELSYRPIVCANSREATQRGVAATLIRFHAHC